MGGCNGLPLSLSLSPSSSPSLSLQKFPSYGKPMDVFVLVLLRLNNMFIYLSADAIMSDRPPLTHANSSQVELIKLGLDPSHFTR